MKRALAAFLFAATLQAQTTDSGSVRGTVVNAVNAPVVGAAIVVANAQTGLHRDTKTDARGNFAIADLPLTGTYRLQVTEPGFANVNRGPFALRAGETARFTITLQPTVNSTVTVFGTTEGVRSDSPELGSRLDANTIAQTPVLGRKLTSLPLLNSAVRPARGTGDVFLNNTLFVINGGGRRQTTFQLDGGTGDDAWGRQTIFTNVPLSTVQEFTVLTNAFSAEYGRTTGAAINVVTQSGTNEYRTDLLGTYRPKAARGDSLQQGSGMFSGPIVADRTHFLVGFERNDQHRDSTITSPLAPSVFTGVYRQTLGMLRLDHELNDANHLMARANIDRFTDTNPSDAVGGLSLPSAARTFRRSATSLQLSDMTVVSDSVVNEARALIQSGAPITQFTPATPSPQFVRPGVSVEGESRSARLFNHQQQLSDTATLSIGRQAIRFGGDVVRSHSGGNGQEFGSPFVLGQFTFKPGIPATVPTSSLTIGDVARFTQGFGNVSYDVNDTIWSLFVQDDWHVSPNLTLNGGLRYDRQTLTDDANNLAPRLGFAYSADPRTAIRGSYGIYYSQLRSNLVAGWALNGPEGFFNFTAAPGQLGFPTSLQPLPGFPAGAALPPRDITVRPGRASYYNRFFDVSKLRFYPDRLLNPMTQQATLGGEREVAPQWFASADLVYARTIDIERNLDANAPAPFDRTAPGQVRSAAAADATRPIVPVANGYRRILVTVNDGESKYRGVQLSVRRSYRDRMGFLASYTWSHTTNNVEPDAPGGDPNDVNQLGREWADSLLDQRHRGVLSGWIRAPLGLTFGGIVTAASGRPFNITTGADNNGDTALVDRPVINGVVIGRNSGRGSSIFDLDLFAEKTWNRLAFRVEAFNVTNHANVYGRNGVYGNDPSGVPLPSFGAPLGGINNVEPPREYQVSVRFRM
jgi:outer membrane receptor protein involved in Fe transport